MRWFGRERHIDKAFAAFSSAPTWTDAIQVILREPVLLGDAAGELLTDSPGLAVSQAAGSLSDDLDEHLCALRLLRQVGAFILPAAAASRSPIATEAIQILADIAHAEADGRRFDKYKQLSALQSAVSGWQQVLTADPGQYLLPSGVVTLRCIAGNRSLQLYLENHQPDAIEYAEYACRSAIDLATATGESAATARAELGFVLLTRRSLDSPPRSAVEAVEQFDLAMDGAPDEPEPRVTLGLSIALIDRGQPDDIHRAAELLKSADSASFPPIELAQIKTDLGNSLLSLYGLEAHERDLDQAVQVLDSISDDARDTEVFAVSRRVLAHALLIRSDVLGFHDDPRRAVALLEDLLPHWTPGTRSATAVVADLVLGLHKLYRQTGDESFLERAVAVGRASEEGPSPNADLAFHLGNAVLISAGKDPQRLAEAIALLQQAADGSPTVMNLIALASAHLSLYLATGSTSAAAAATAACRKGLEISRYLFASSSLSQQLQQDSQTWEIFPLAILCLLEQARAQPEMAWRLHREAMLTAEASQSRLLGAHSGVMGPPAPPSVPTLLAQREQLLVGEIAASDSADFQAWAQDSAYVHSTDSRARSNAASKRQELLTLWSEIEGYSSDAREWVNKRRGDPARWDDIARAAGPGMALVSFAEPASELVAFVFRNGDSEPTVVRSGISMADLETCVVRLRRDIGVASRPETWDVTLRELLLTLQRHIGDADRIVLSPVAVTPLIPWAVAAYRVGWRSRTGGPLALLTAPGVRTLSGLEGRPQSDRREVTVVGDPQGNLGFAATEARAIAARLGADCLLGDQATCPAVLARMCTSRLVHLAAHASFNADSPLDSGVMLADGVLTCREILAAPVQADLVVLSACETGAVGSLGGNEAAGLGQAFLYAGARSVVMSLWRVDDQVTSVLMGAFYAEIAEHGDLALALAQASETVRSHDEWQHARYWGAFMLMGAPNLPVS